MVAMESDKAKTLTCTVIAMDTQNNFCYRVCSTCERTVPDSTNNNFFCKHCNFNAFNPIPSRPKRLFRILMSIASDTKVFVVIFFDRAAKVLFGCSADQFFDFAKTHPFAVENAGTILEGEMLRVTLSKPKNGNAQHLRVASVTPLRSDFKPVIETLNEHYRVQVPS